MKIAIDAMGGDFAPQAIVEGAILAAKEFTNDIKIVLVGIKDAIQKVLDEQPEVPANIEVFHADEVIEMGEHPTKALQQKPKSSINVGFHLLKNNEIQAFCGAGNTGAMHVGAIFSVKPIDGIMRPCLITHVPKTNGGTSVMLDVGANTDCKPEMLYQFGVLGRVYCKEVLCIENPRVALMNLGEEAGKGNMDAKEAYQLLKADTKLNFVGNIEGRDLFLDKMDVIVCDGFVGNVILKMAESIYEIAAERGVKDDFLNKLNYEAIGGSPILGVNGNVIIGHGISNAIATKNMILLAYKIASADLNNKIKTALQNVV